MKSTALLEQLKTGLETISSSEKSSLLKKVNGLFELILKDGEGNEETWTLDIKTTGEVTKGKPKSKADVVLNMNDDTFVDLSNGKINGQKAFMAGKLKIKGNMMLATKLDVVLKTVKEAKAKL